MMTREVSIVSFARTPIGSFLGSLSLLEAPRLGAIAIKAAIQEAKIECNEISEVYMGCVLTSAMGQGPARQAALKAGIDYSVPCTTIGKVCGSGLKAIMLGAQAIACNQADIVVAGGMESMSNAPYALQKARKGLRMGHDQFIDTMIYDGLWDMHNNFHMGTAAELCAKEKHISRQSQDAYAIHSYEKSLQAIKEKRFEKEIVPVIIKSKKNMEQKIQEDEEPSRVQFDKMPTLSPAFEENGTITAGNASSLSDGAAAVVLMASDLAKKRKIPSFGKIVAFTQSAREPEWFTLAPVDAITAVLRKCDWTIDSVDLFEINEAFAVVCLAVTQALCMDLVKVNVHGGAISLGHPIGASGARVLVTLLNAMAQHNKKRGIVSLCIGGGEAIAMGIEQ